MLKPIQRKWATLDEKTNIGMRAIIKKKPLVSGASQCSEENRAWVANQYIEETP